MVYSPSQTAPARVLYTRYSPSGTDSTGLLQATSPARIIAPAWAPLHRPQLLPGACFFAGSPWAAVAFRAYPPAITWDPPQGGVWVSALVGSYTYSSDKRQ